MARLNFFISSLIGGLFVVQAHASCDEQAMWAAFPDFDGMAGFAQTYLDTYRGDVNGAFLVVGEFSLAPEYAGVPFAHELMEVRDLLARFAVSRNEPHPSPSHIPVSDMSIEYQDAVHFTGVRIEGDRFEPFQTDRTAFTVRMTGAPVGGAGPPSLNRPVVRAMSQYGRFIILEELICDPLMLAIHDAFAVAAADCLNADACDISATPLDRPVWLQSQD